MFIQYKKLTKKKPMRIRPAILLCLLGQTLASLSQQLPSEIFDISTIPALAGELSFLCLQDTTTVESCITLLKTRFENNWPALDALFLHQIDCWRQFATAFGYYSFGDMID